MTSSEYGQQGAKDDADAILVDHSLVTKNSRTTLWPVAIGSVATILVLAGIASALLQRESMEQEITTLSQELRSSRKSVERLITETALLERKLNALIDSTQSGSSVIDSESPAGIEPADPSSKDAIYVAAGQSKEPSGEIVATIAEPANEAVAETDTATSLADALDQSSYPPDTAESAGGSQRVFPLLATTPDVASADTGNSLGPWAVVVGAFSNESNLNNLVLALEREGYSVMAQSITRDGWELQRIKVIGFNAKSDAINAAAAIEQTYRTGRLWVVADPMVGGISGQAEPVSRAPLASSSQERIPSKEEQDASLLSAIYESSGSLGLSENIGSSAAGWFIYIDSFTDSNAANDLIRELVNKGYNAKLAVEYRAGNLYYMVQVVGIDSRKAGEDIFSNLVESSDLPNIQLRTY